MRSTLLLAALGLALPSAASAQILLTENFAYPDSTALSGAGFTPIAPNPQTGWGTHSGTAGQIKTGMTDNLAFTSTPGYSAQSGGGIRLFAARGEDISKTFAAQTEDATATKSVYMSALVRPDAVPNGTNGSYFLNLANTAVTGATFSARVFMAQGVVDPTKVRFGITTIGNVPVFAPTEYAIGTTVLLVARYDLVPGPTNNTARLYIFERGANLATEPTTANAIATDTGTDPTEIGSVAIRQGTTTAPTGSTPASQNSGNQTVDGLRVSTSWASLSTSADRADVLASGLGLSVRSNASAVPVLALTSDAAGTVSVDVFDVLGRRVAAHAVSAAPGTTADVAVSGLAAGVYVVRAVRGTAVATTRLVVR